MSQDTSATAAQAAAASDAQAATSDALAADEKISLEDARKLRSENANLRKRAKDAEDAKAAIESAKLTDAEKLKKQHDALLAENTTLKTEAQSFKAQQAALAAGAKPGYAELVATKIPAEAIADKKELDKRLAELKTEFPDLFNGRGSADGGAGGGGPANTENMNTRIRRAAGRR